ncbi:hypothetical protein [Vibrio splendidus]|uniref:hypothetical protein n=1 Tax=Vibrio splendidus TaxID=29497 RepID=UPI00352C88CE
MLAKLRRWREKPTELKVYFVGDVSEFLTDDAKVHKRNLMYVSVILLAFSYAIGVNSIKSAFGFEFDQPISAVTCVFILNLVVAYELFMLLEKFSDCKLQWFYQTLDEKGKLPRLKETVEKFQKTFPASTEHLKVRTFNIKSITSEIERSQDNLQSAKEEWSNSGIKNEINILEGKINDFSDLLTEFRDKIKSIDDEATRIDLSDRLDCLKGYHQVVESLEASIRNINSHLSYDYLSISETNDNLKKIASEIDDYGKKIDELHIIKDELVTQLSAKKRGLMRKVTIHFIIPTLSAGIAVTYSIHKYTFTELFSSILRLFS